MFDLAFSIVIYGMALIIVGIGLYVTFLGSLAALVAYCQYRDRVACESDGATHFETKPIPKWIALIVVAAIIATMISYSTLYSAA